MKLSTFLLPTLALLVFCHCNSPQKQTETPKPSMESLMAALEEFNTAFKTGDTQTLRSMITEDYLHTNGSSKAIDGTTWVGYLEGRSQQISEGNLEVTAYGMDDIEVVFYGHTAIVTGKVTVANKKLEQREESQYRVTHIWVNELGKWKRAGFHDGKIQ